MDEIRELVDRRWEEYGIGVDPTARTAPRGAPLRRLLQR